MTDIFKTVTIIKVYIGATAKIVKKKQLSVFYNNLNWVDCHTFTQRHVQLYILTYTWPSLDVNYLQKPSKKRCLSLYETNTFLRREISLEGIWPVFNCASIYPNHWYVFFFSTSISGLIKISSLHCEKKKNTRSSCTTQIFFLTAQSFLLNLILDNRFVDFSLFLTTVSASYNSMCTVHIYINVVLNLESISIWTEHTHSEI